MRMTHYRHFRRGLTGKIISLSLSLAVLCPGPMGYTLMPGSRFNDIEEGSGELESAFRNDTELACISLKIEDLLVRFATLLTDDTIRGIIDHCLLPDSPLKIPAANIYFDRDRRAFCMPGVVVDGTKRKLIYQLLPLRPGESLPENAVRLSDNVVVHIETPGIRTDFESEAVHSGGKIAWAMISERYAKAIGYKIPESIYLGMEDVWTKFIKANRALVDEGNELITGDLERYGTPSENTMRRLRKLMHRFRFPKELSRYIKERTEGMQGPVIIRSSGRYEDSYERNLAGIFTSPKKDDPRLIAQGVRELLEDAVITIWTGQYISGKRIETLRTLENTNGFGILVQPFIQFEASGVTMTNLYGRTILESVIGSAETAVRPDHANVAQFVFRKGQGQAADFDFFPSFSKTPHEIVLGGVTYNAERDAESMAVLMGLYPKIDGTPSPLTPEQAREIYRISSKLEEEIGTPLDIEWGFLRGDPYVVQIRPMVGDFNKNLVEPSPELAGKQEIARTPIALGETDTRGFTGRMVLFGKDVDRATVKAFEREYDHAYIRVQANVAMSVAADTTKAKVIVDPAQGTRQAHAVSLIMEKIARGEFMYANGPVLRAGLAQNLAFVPHLTLEGVWVSSENITYFSNGLDGSFYISDEPEPISSAPFTTRQAILMKFHAAVNGKWDHLSPEWRDGALAVLRERRGLLPEALSNPLYPPAWDSERMKRYQMDILPVHRKPAAAQLPTAYAEASKIAAPGHGRADADTGKVRVLLFDDDNPTMILAKTLFKNKLSPEEYEVDFVLSGRDNLEEKLDSSLYDLVAYDASAVFGAAPSLISKLLDRERVGRLILHTGQAFEDTARGDIARLSAELNERSEYLLKLPNCSNLIAAIKACREEKLASRGMSLSPGQEKSRARKGTEEKEFTVFVIDNNPNVAHDLGEFLNERFGNIFEVAAIDSASGFRRSLEASTPDIVITGALLDNDRMLDEVLRSVSERNSDTPFIITRRMAAITSPREIGGYNVIGVIEKPFHFDDVADTVNGYLSAESGQHLIDAAIEASERTGQEGGILIGIDTSWIPGIQLPYLQKLLNVLTSDHKNGWARNIKIVRANGTALAETLADTLKPGTGSSERAGIPMSNVIILGDKRVLESHDFDRFRNRPDPAGSAFFAGVVLPEGSLGTTDIRLLDMLAYAIKRAMEKDAVKSCDLNITTNQIDINDLIRRYERREAFITAA